MSQHYVHWISVPFSALKDWVFVMLELIKEFDENPFSGFGNDIPMLSLCRTIVNDLREVIGEIELLEPIEPVNDVLM